MEKIIKAAAYDVKAARIEEIVEMAVVIASFLVPMMMFVWGADIVVSFAMLIIIPAAGFVVVMLLAKHHDKKMDQLEEAADREEFLRIEQKILSDSGYQHFSLSKESEGKDVWTAYRSTGRAYRRYSVRFNEDGTVSTREEGRLYNYELS